MTTLEHAVDHEPTADVDAGRRRVVVENVRPQIDGGQYPIKRVIGEQVAVTADVFTDGHDAIGCVLKFRGPDDAEWSETPMLPLVNDAWEAEFTVEALGQYRYTVEAWIDAFASWQRDLKKRVAAAQDVAVDLLIGVKLIREAAERAGDEDARRLEMSAGIVGNGLELDQAIGLAMSDEMAELMAKWPDRRLATPYDKELAVYVDRPQARFSTWYEMFPRSASPEPGRHGTFRDCMDRLPHIAGLGFDVLYLPPIHPIGRKFRKGKNNSVTAGDGEPGSPWAIGAEEGGHKAIHPELGTLDDFRALVARAAQHGVEIALDIAYQCAPDHPYVAEHPDWFRARPDGTIQYAENPPKKYQDIYPFNFETEDWRALWEELRDVILHWVEQGVRIFRVDNPHTKPFRFWQWLISDVKARHPDVLFLAEAFTRPKVMHRLAKLGFTQSYTYFAWRNTKAELTKYLTDLTQTELGEYFRPNLWPNTPDILTEYLQFGGRPAFMNRLVLAATLGASYGIYGPPFERALGQAALPGSEEYLDSEKYEVRCWDWESPDTLKDFISRVNHIRRGHPPLQSNSTLRFHEVDNDQLICYSKQTADRLDTILMVVNLDTRYTQAGWVTLPLEELGIDPEHPFQARDLLSDSTYIWNGPRNYVQLSPHALPAHILHISRRVRTERQFEYYL